jgi:hypothetical protein
VNFHKSLLVRVNVAVLRLEEASSVLYCNVGCVSFEYLSLPIGGNPRRLSFWLEKFIVDIWDKLCIDPGCGGLE